MNRREFPVEWAHALCRLGALLTGLRLVAGGRGLWTDPGPPDPAGWLPVILGVLLVSAGAVPRLPLAGSALGALARAMARTWKLWLPVAAGLFPILVLEAACSLILPPRVPHFSRFLEGGFFVPDPILGYKPRPSSRVSLEMRDPQGRTLYRATYHTDACSRRITPRLATQPAEAFALFFGCSMTFGEGLQDDETLPARFADLRPRYRSYNYAFSGYGPQQMLEHLKNPELPAQIGEGNGILVYPFIDDHVPRAIGSMVVVENWGRTFPCYALDASGNLRREGTFWSARPVVSRLYQMLFLSETVRFFDLSFPPRLTAGHLRLTSAIIAESYRQFKARFPAGRFVLLLYPGTKLRGVVPQPRPGPDFHLADFSDLPWSDPALLLPDRWHPSARGNVELAQRLAEHLDRLP